MGILKIELELPEEILEYLAKQDIEKSIKKLIVLDLLREHKISQGKASELLGINRWELLKLMELYSIPAIDLTTGELKEELERAREIFRDQ